ncbi:hypothetical protein JL722_6725 [Aureococcus anophagefferens]|nr:hypothetical protein JL722_6725 [Aureococcus anophagefferens]
MAHPGQPMPTLDSPEMLLLRSECATDDAPWLPSDVWLPQAKRGAWGGGAGTGAAIEPVFNAGRLPFCCGALARAQALLRRARGLAKPAAEADWRASLVAARLALRRLPEGDDALQSWLHQPRCAVCGDAASPLKRCQRCHGAAFCDRHRDAAHERASCDAAMLEIACFGMISDMGAPLTIASRSPARAPLPGGWKAYFDMKIWDFEVPAYILSMGPPAAMLTEGLSLPLLLVGLHRLREIFAWLPRVDELRVQFVGPDLARDRAEARAPDERDGGSVKPVFFSETRAYYHDARRRLRTPTIVLAQHGGLHDPLFAAAWAPTLDLLLDEGAPCVFTGYNEAEGAADAAVLRERGAKFVADAHLNPFRGLRPYSEVAGCAAEFYHVNAYACCVEGRAQ